MEKQGKRFSKKDRQPPVPASAEQNEINEPEKKEDQRLKDKNAKKLEKLMKKQRRRERRSEREVLSYEEMPLSEREASSASKQSKWNAKKVIAAGVIVAILFGAVFFVANPDRFSVHNIVNFFNYGLLNRSSEESFPMDVFGESITAGNFVRRGQDICFSSDTKTQMLNNYGRSVFKTPHAFINPILKVSDKYALVYNLGGTGYQMIDSEGNAYSADTQDNIMLADVNSDGVYALVTQSSGYLSKLCVYNEKNEQIYAYSFADYYVTAAAVSSTGKQAVVAGVSALNGMDIASLYVLDFTRDTPLFFSEFENNILYDVDYLGERYACAVGRSASYVIHTGNGSVEVCDYEGRTQTAYDINPDTDTYTLSLSGSGDGRNCDIISFRSSGKQDRSFRVEEAVTALSTYKGRVVLLSNNTLYLYGKDGTGLSSKELVSDCHAIALYTGSDVYVLCTGTIDSVSM